jgi:hypothetical protein
MHFRALCRAVSFEDFSFEHGPDIPHRASKGGHGRRYGDRLTFSFIFGIAATAAPSLWMLFGMEGMKQSTKATLYKSLM